MIAHELSALFHIWYKWRQQKQQLRRRYVRLYGFAVTSYNSDMSLLLCFFLSSTLQPIYQSRTYTHTMAKPCVLAAFYPFTWKHFVRTICEQWNMCHILYVSMNFAIEMQDYSDRYPACNVWHVLFWIILSSKSEGSTGNSKRSANFGDSTTFIIFWLDFGGFVWTTICFG